MKFGVFNGACARYAIAADMMGLQVEEEVDELRNHLYDIDWVKMNLNEGREKKDRVRLNDKKPENKGWIMIIHLKQIRC